MEHPISRQWSLANRLSLLIACSIIGVFGVLATLLDHWIDHEFYERMDFGLEQRASVLAKVLETHETDWLERLIPDYDLTGHTEFFSVFNEQGEAIANSPNSGGVALALQLSISQPRSYYDVDLPDGHPGRAIAVRVNPAAPDAHASVLVVGTERSSWDRTENRIHLVLMLGIALATAIAIYLAATSTRRLIDSLCKAGQRATDTDQDNPGLKIEGNFPKELIPFVHAFNQGLDHLYRAVERERRFSRDIAHELRTPLTEIRVRIENMANAVSDQTTEPTPQRHVLAACDRMQRSIDTLLFLAQLESENHTLAPDPIDLAGLTREIIESLGYPPSAKKNLVHTDFPVAAWTLNDLGITERIIYNLLGNALEYAPAQDDIQCGIRHDQNGWIWWVNNAAPELEEDDLAHLGDRFWRKQTEGSTGKHAGLGLALTFALAKVAKIPLEFELSQGRLTARLGPWPSI